MDVVAEEKLLCAARNTLLNARAPGRDIGITKAVTVV
jgi:hypothetical protein